ncbi:MAG: hypothetical protein ACRD3V_21170 [Vicinamibacteria bacterium]
MTGGYAVLWREGKGSIYAGKVELDPGALRLEGSCHGRRRSFRTIRYEDLAGVSLTRAPEERLFGKLTLILELREGAAVDIAALNRLGTVRELEEEIAIRATKVPVD